MISLEKCEVYLNECQALGAEGKLTLRQRPRLWPSAMPGSR